MGDTELELVHSWDLDRRSASAIYRKLDATRLEIRILVIISSDPLELGFEYACLREESTRPFNAISWCWGSARDRSEVVVEGVPVSIPANAYEILQDLCVLKQKHRVWIDAICIDQDNILERNQQVRIMQMIYSRADMTLIWLGKDNGTAKQAMESIVKIDGWRRIRHMNNPLLDTNTFWNEQTTDPLPSMIDWEAMASFFSAPWFRRFWIIQEVVLSKHVHVFQGRHEMCWNFLVSTAHYLVHNGAFHSSLQERERAGLKNIVTIASAAAHADMTEVLTLLKKSEDFEATEPRDRVFAMYGLIQRNSGDEFLHEVGQPDYKKSLASVYTEITWIAISRAPKNFLEVVLKAQQTIPRTSSEPDARGFPSWVPRYHFVTDVTRGSYKAAARYTWLGSAQFDQYVQIETNTPHNILRLTGLVVDTVMNVQQPLLSVKTGHSGEASGADYEPLVNMIQNLWHSARTANPGTPPAELASTLRATLIGCHSTKCSAHNVDLSTRHAYRAFATKFWPLTDNAPMEYELHDQRRDVEIDDADMDDEYSDDGYLGEAEQHSSGQHIPVPEDNVNDEALNFCHAVAINHANRVFFTAESGRIGSAATRARKDDKICIIFGIDIPVVLRQHGNCWELIGDAYLTDIIKNADDLEDYEKLKAKTKWFDLR